jgi:hypothetical protein
VSILYSLRMICVVVFCNVVISASFNYMHRNSILHTINNSDVGLITSWLSG